MFKDEYKLQMDSIKADSDVKQKVLKSLNTKKPKIKKKPTLLIFRTAAAVAASIAVVLSVIIAKDSYEPQIAVGNEKKTYDDIYKTVEAFIPETDMLGEFIEGVMNFGNKGADDEEIEYEYEYTTDDIATGTNGSFQKTSPSFTDSNSAKQDAAEESDGEYSETNTQVKGDRKSVV